MVDVVDLVDPVEIDIQFSVVWFRIVNNFCVVLCVCVCVSVRSFVVGVGMNERETRAREGYQRTVLLLFCFCLQFLYHTSVRGFP